MRHVRRSASTSTSTTQRTRTGASRRGMTSLPAGSVRVNVPLPHRRTTTSSPAACESTPFSIRSDVKRRDEFWLKTQPYSLEDMLANDEAVEKFVGGTVYQAFLSATNYHRWHSPVAGTIVQAFVVEGTYYSEADSLGSDAGEPTHSQAYLAHVAARAVFLIEADNPAIGLVGFVPVGMSEVSSCLIHPSIDPGHHVAKGEELGHFQFGGSTHCLIFGPGVIGDFAMAAIPQPHDPDAPLVLVRSRLGTVRNPQLVSAVAENRSGSRTPTPMPGAGPVAFWLYEPPRCPSNRRRPSRRRSTPDAQDSPHRLSARPRGPLVQWRRRIQRDTRVSPRYAETALGMNGGCCGVPELSMYRSRAVRAFAAWGEVPPAGNPAAPAPDWFPAWKSGD